LICQAEICRRLAKNRQAVDSAGHCRRKEVEIFAGKRGCDDRFLAIWDSGFDPFLPHRFAIGRDRNGAAAGTVGNRTCSGPLLSRSSTWGHPLVRLVGKIDWGFSTPAGRGLRAGDGRPPLPVRQVAGLLILKPMHSLKRRSCSVRAGARTPTFLVPERRARGSRTRPSSKLLDWEYQPAA
jgi:hypothetical protein